MALIFIAGKGQTLASHHQHPQAWDGADICELGRPQDIGPSKCPQSFSSHLVTYTLPTLPQLPAAIFFSCCLPFLIFPVRLPHPTINLAVYVTHQSPFGIPHLAFLRACPVLGLPMLP
jgi:hypothetical protein